MNNKFILTLLGCAALEAFSARPAVADTIADNGFEQPNMGHYYWTANYQYNPAGTGWNFTGQTGVAANGSGFGVLNAFNGNSDGTTSDLGQAGFIQNGNGLLSGAGSSVIGQTLTLNAGFYTLNFEVEGRDYGAGSNPITAYLLNESGTTTYLDSSDTPPSQLGNSLSQINFTPVTDVFQVPSTGKYGLFFVGNGNGGQDVTTFIDNVSIDSATTHGQNLAIPLPSAAWAGAALLGGLYLLTVGRNRRGSSPASHA